MHRKIIIISAVVSVVFLFIASTVSKKFQQQENKILPNIYIDSINVGYLTQEQANTILNKLYKSKSTFSVIFEFEKKPIFNLTASEISYKLPIKEVVEQAYSVGRGSKFFSRVTQRVSLLLGWEEYRFVLEPQYNKESIKKQLQELDEAYRINPQEARFKFVNGRVTAFQIDKPGFSLDITTALNKLEKELAKVKKTEVKTITIKIAKKHVLPKIRLQDINNFGITELVAEGKSQFLGSSAERIHNIQVGSAKLNGIIIKPDEIFSFNKSLGEISTTTGFKPAFVIKNGKTVLGDGGGICQVSTTLFRSALNAGLPIVERHAHAYRVSYYEQDSQPGYDATIYSPSIDFKFKNDYQNALLIQSSINLEQMVLVFSLYGKKDERKIEISKAVVWNVVPPPPPEYIDDYSLPEGVTKQIDFAAPGASVKFNYKVSKNNVVVYQNEFVSNFRPWKAIFLVGKKVV